MPTYQFTGKVLPFFNEFTMDGTMKVDWNVPILPPDSLVMSAILTIRNGIIEIACESNLSGTDEYDANVYGRALDFATTVVNLFAFGKGMGLTVSIETVVKTDGVTYNIQEQQPDLAPLVTALDTREGGINVTTLMPLVLSDPTIFVALSDLIGSVNRTQEAPIKCGRAVDAIRHYMAPQNDRKAGWPTMRDNLNLSQPFLEFITEISKGPRHGNIIGTTVAANKEAMRRAWIVMNRFLEFKKRGGQQLPLADFPPL